MTVIVPFKLDLKDKKILYELDCDSRQPASKIAKKVGLSSEVVNYRIKKLEENNIITQYQLILNLSKLNIIQFKLGLRFQHTTSKEESELIEKLKKREEVKWIVSTKGNWDLLLAVETHSLEQIDELKDELVSLCERRIAKKSISILVEAITYNRDYLLDKDSITQDSRAIMKLDSIITLDEEELKILKLLSKNCRLSIIKISEKLGLTPRIINYKIKSLITKKLILGFKIAINYEKLGIKFYKTFIYLDNPSKEKLQEFKNYCESQKNIIHHVKVLGNWDLEPEFEVHSEKEFNEQLTLLKDKFSDIIKQIDVLTITKEHKFVYF